MVSEGSGNVVANIVRFVSAAVLVFASLSKWVFFSELVISRKYWGGGKGLALVILLELIIACVVLVGSWVVAWRLLMLLFATLSVVSIYSSLMGVECGCFGFAIPEWVVAAFDLSVLVSVTSTSKFWKNEFRVMWNCRSVLLALLIITAVMLSGVWKSSSDGCGDVIVTEDLLGEPLPFLKRSSSLSALGNGRHLLVFLSPNCEHCKQFVENASMGSQEEASVVSVVMNGGTWNFNFGELALTSSGRGQVDWGKCGGPFISTPSVIILNDGVVEWGRSGSSAEEAFQAFRGVK